PWPSAPSPSTSPSPLSPPNEEAPAASPSSSLSRRPCSLPLSSLAIAPDRGGGSAAGSAQLRVRRTKVREAAARMVAGDGSGATRGGGTCFSPSILDSSPN
uniref:Uncharacterized protein n=1 Tax=Triticum urartu TaxID=4572 RepID=A0A8R7PKB6_TRIUA